MPGNPEYLVYRDSNFLLDALVRWHQANIQRSRRQTHLRAADLTLGESRDAWRADVKINGAWTDKLAQRNDEGLGLVLTELAKLPRWGYRRRTK